VFAVPKIVDEGIGGGAHDIRWLEFLKTGADFIGEAGAGEEGLGGKGIFDNTAQMARRFEMPEGERLDEDIADGRGLDGAGDDLDAGGIGGKLVKEMPPWDKKRASFREIWALAGPFSAASLVSSS